MTSEVALLLLFVGLIAVIATWVASWLNRDITALQEKSRTVIRKRLEVFPRQCSLESFISNNVAVDYKENARILLDEISKLLQVSVDSLSFDARLCDVLRVSRAELGEMKLSNRQPPPNCVEPFTYDLLYVLENLVDSKSCDEQWKSMPEPPRNEEELAEFVMAMSMPEFLRFFAPLVSQVKGKRSTDQ